MVEKKKSADAGAKSVHYHFAVIAIDQKNGSDDRMRHVQPAQ